NQTGNIHINQRVATSDFDPKYTLPGWASFQFNVPAGFTKLFPDLKEGEVPVRLYYRSQGVLRFKLEDLTGGEIVKINNRDCNDLNTNSAWARSNMTLPLKEGHSYRI